MPAVATKMAHKNDPIITTKPRYENNFFLIATRPTEKLKAEAFQNC